MKEIEQQRKAFWKKIYKKKKSWICLHLKFSGEKGRDEFSPVTYYQDTQKKSGKSVSSAATFSCSLQSKAAQKPSTKAWDLH